MPITSIAFMRDRRTGRGLGRCCVAATMLLAAAPAAAQRSPTATDWSAFDSARLSGMRYRMIGPARGGRVTTVTGVNQEPHTFYMGATGGGVWKTTDAGASWHNISDGAFATGSIGAMDVADSDPEHHLRRHRLGGDPQQRLHRQGDLQVDATPGEAGASSACATPARSARSSCTRPTPTSSTPPCVGNPFAELADARRLPHARRRRDLAARALPLRQHRRGGHRAPAGQPRRRLRVDVARRATPVDDHQRRRRGRHLQEHRRRRHLDEARRRPAHRRRRQERPRRLGGGAAARVRARRGEGRRRALSLRRRRRRAGRSSTRRPGSSRAPSTTTTSTPIPRTPTSSTSAPRASTSRPTAADLPHDAHAARRQPRHVDQPARRPHLHPVERRRRERHAQRRAHLEHAVEPADGRDLPGRRGRPVSRIACTARSRTTARSSSPACRVGAAGLDDPIQSWRQGPGCETGPIIPHRTNPDTVYGGCKGQFSRMSLRTGQEQQYWVGAQSLYGNANQDLLYRFQRVSPMEVSPHDSRTRLLRLAVRAPHARRGRHLGAHQPRPHRERSALPRDDLRRRRSRSTSPAKRCTPRSTPSANRRSTPGVIWAGANDGPIHVTRDNGKTLDERHAGRPAAGRPRAEHRAVAAPRRRRLRRRRALPARRLRAVHLQDRGLRAELDAAHRRHATASPPTRRRAWCARTPTAPACSTPAPSSACTSRSTTARTGARFQLNLPVTPVTDIARAPAGPRAVHAGTRVLDPRRPHARCTS